MNLILTAFTVLTKRIQFSRSPARSMLQTALPVYGSIFANLQAAGRGPIRPRMGERPEGIFMPAQTAA